MQRRGGVESLHCALVVWGAQSSHYLSRILFFATFCLHLHLFDYSNDLLPFLVKGGLTEFQIRMCLVKFFHWLSKCSDRNRLAKKSWGFGQRWSWFASIKLRPWSFARHFLVFCRPKTDAKKVVLYEALTFAIRHKFNLNSKTVCCSFYLEWINKASLNTIFIVLPKKPKDLFMWWHSKARYFSCSEL